MAMQREAIEAYTEEEFDERTLTERAAAWDGADRAELDELFYVLGDLCDNAMKHDEDLDEDVRAACIELLANPTLPTLYHA